MVPVQTKNSVDSTLNVVIRPRMGSVLSGVEQQKMIAWLSARTKAKSIDLIIESRKK